MHLLILSIFLYYLMSCTLVSSHGFKRAVEEDPTFDSSAFGGSALDDSNPDGSNLALLNPNAGTGSAGLAVSNLDSINVPEQMPGTLKLAQVLRAPSGRTMQNPGTCTGGKNLACCNGNRCVSLQVVLDAGTSHSFCFKGITCCARIEYGLEPLDSNDHLIGKGVDCDSEKNSSWDLQQWLIDILNTDARDLIPAGVGSGPALEW